MERAMLARLRVFARALVHRAEVDRELKEELRYHLDREVALLESRGLSRDEAQRAAWRHFGNVSVTAESSRAAYRVQLLDDLAGDIRYAARALRRTPLFTAVAILTIALGVGANAAVFGVIDAVLLKTLPVRDPDQLVFVRVVGSQGEQYGGPPYPWVEQLRAEANAFDGMAVFATDQLPVVIDGRAEQLVVQVASGEYFELLGVKAIIGRTLTRDDERLNPPVAVIGYGYWQRRFGGRRDLVGTTIRYNNRSVTIVGVTPRGFGGLQTGEQVDITIPVTVVGFGLLRDTGAFWSSTVARMRPGVSASRALADVNPIYASLDANAARPGVAGGRRLEFAPASRGLDRLRRTLEAPLLLVLGAVAAVLLIGCANIANLLSVRAAARRRELAVRSALGAGRGRLARQLLTESVLLFTLGALAGLLVAKGVQRVLDGYLSAGRLPIVLDLGLDARLLAVAGGLALVAGLLSGLAPAVRAGGRRANAFVDLRLSGDRSGGASPVSRSLIVIQVAMSIAILLGGGLLLQTLINLRSVDLGFRPDGVLTLSVRPLASSYPDEKRGEVFERVLQRVREIPGVESASLSVLTPLSGRDRGRRVAIPGVLMRSESDRDVRVNYVSPGYFETFGIPITLGRPLGSADDARAPKVALMNAAAASFYFGGRPAFGTPISFDPPDQPPASYSLIGVAGDSRHRTVRDAAPRFVFLPISQAPDSPSRLSLAVRTRMVLPAIAEVVRQEVGRVGPDILVSDVETLGQQVDRALLLERLVSTLSVTFAVLGVLLAALGLYGVTSYSVLSRTTEIGIRMALGSSPGAVRWLMLRQAFAMGVVGVAVGLPCGLVAATTIRRLLYGVAPTDPVIAATCVVLLLVITAVAGFLPARRASRIDPVRALSAQ
jgi:predicted permease